MPTARFQRLAGWCALSAAALALFYSVTFAIVVKHGSRWASWSSRTALALGGLVALPLIAAIYLRVRTVDEGFALVALLVGTASAFGSMLHGTNDLAVMFNPPKGTIDLPNATDARGFTTFALLALSIALSSWLLVRSGLPSRFATLGYAAAALLVVVYIGRLTVLDPNKGWIAAAAGLSGLLAVPAWYGWLGRALLRLESPAVAPALQLEPA